MYYCSVHGILQKKIILSAKLGTSPLSILDNSIILCVFRFFDSFSRGIASKSTIDFPLSSTGWNFSSKNNCSSRVICSLVPVWEYEKC